MKKRTYSLFLLALAALLGTALFITSGRVQHTEKLYAEAQKKYDLTEDAVKILRAEWTYLNRPDRLEELAATYLNLSAQPIPTIAKTAAALPTAKQHVVPTIKPAAIPASFKPAGRNTADTADTHLTPTPITPRFDQLMKQLAKGAQ